MGSLVVGSAAAALPSDAVGSPERKKINQEQRFSGCILLF